MAVNYLNLDRFPILYNHYVFVDTSDYLADQLFIRHKVRVHFGEEMEHPEFPYIFIFCKVRKKNRQRFLEALQENDAPPSSGLRRVLRGVDRKA